MEYDLNQKMDIIKLRAKYKYLSLLEFCEIATEILGFECFESSVSRIIENQKQQMEQERWLR